MEIPAPNTDLPMIVVKQTILSLVLYYVFKIVPALISGLSIFLGYRLFILGVTGQASIVVNSTTIGGQLINASPGLFFAVGGIVALIFSIIKGVSIKQKSDRDTALVDARVR